MIVNKKALKDTLVLANKLTAARKLKPILGLVLLEMGPNVFVVTATDLDIRLRRLVDVEEAGEKFSRVLVDGKRLAQVVRSTPGKTVELEVMDKGTDKVLLVGGVLEMDISTDVDEFPARVGDMDGAFGDVTLTPQNIQDMFRRTAFATADVGIYFAQDGILFQADGAVAATNGRQLAVSRDVLSPLSWTAIVPKLAFEIASKVFDDDVTVQRSKSVIHFDNGKGTEIHARMIEGEFPEYENVIPDPSKLCYVDIDRATFQEAVEKAEQITQGQEIEAMTLTFEDEVGIKITAKHEGVGSLDAYAYAVVPSPLANGQKISLDPDYVLGWLKSLKKRNRRGVLYDKNHHRVHLGLRTTHEWEIVAGSSVTFQDPDEQEAIYVLSTITDSTF